MKRRIAIVFALCAFAFTIGGAQSVLAAPAGAAREQPQAEIFATNNTATITNPSEPGLKTHLLGFEVQVDGMILRGGSDPERSTLLDGVFWDSGLQQTTYERSREFDVDHIDTAHLHSIADAIRVRYHQDSVLTFRFLPRQSADTDAFQVEVPGVNVTTLHDKLVADPTVRDRLQGGSVTLQHRLILIGATTDFPLVQQFVGELGGDMSKATITYGAWEFVSAP